MEDYKEFFKRVGDHVLFPKSCGENFWAIPIEELYQMFKQRYQAEECVDGAHRETKE